MAGSVVFGLAFDAVTYVPIGIGCAVGAGVLTVIGRRRRAGPVGPAVAVTGDWDDHEESFANRRTSVRRAGRPVPVAVTSSTFRGQPEAGYVIDRSTGGLKLVLPVSVPAGATLQVKATDAPDTVPWVTVIVRSCRPAKKKSFELGCEFDATPPWNVLLLFG